MIRADYADSFPIRLAWDLTGESGIDEGTLTEVTMLLARVTPLIRLRGVKRLQLATEYNGALTDSGHALSAPRSSCAGERGLNAPRTTP